MAGLGRNVDDFVISSKNKCVVRIQKYYFYGGIGRLNIFESCDFDLMLFEFFLGAKQKAPGRWAVRSTYSLVIELKQYLLKTFFLR